MSLWNRDIVNISKDIINISILYKTILYFFLNISMSFFLWLLSWILFCVFLCYLFYKRTISKANEHRYVEDMNQLKETLHTFSSIKASILFWLDINKLWLQDDIQEAVKHEMIDNLQDKTFRNKIRDTFWLALYDILLWLWCDEKFLQEIEKEESEYFKNDELKSFEFKNKTNI